MNLKKRRKSNIEVGTLVKSKVRDMEYNTREGIITRMMVDVVGCVHYLVAKNNFLGKF